VAGWQVGRPSPWRDEGATWALAGRPLGQLLAVTRHVDLVHLPYYLLAHPILRLDDSVVSVRLLSVVATAVTAALLVAIGRRTGSLRVGVASGALFAVSPLASRYGQEARPYALAATATTLSTLALLAALDRRADGLRGGWPRYALSVVVVGLVNVFALLVLAAHLAYLLPRAAGDRRRWLLAVGGACVPLAPFVIAVSTQVGQVGWLHRPAGSDLVSVLAAPWGGWVIPAALLAAALLLAAFPPRGLAPVHRPTLLLGTAWALLPPVLLWGVSQLHPLFDGRYLVAALPGAALALGSLATVQPNPAEARPTVARFPVARFPVARFPVGLLLPAALLAVAGLPAQIAYRDPSSGHAEDVRGTDRIMAAGALPGDAVLFIPWHLRIVAQMYPGDTRTLADVALGRGPIESATISGLDRPADQLPAALAPYSRVWLVTSPAGLVGTTASDAAKAYLLGRDFLAVQSSQVPYFTITLYRRRTPAG
jgi:mannosyltransferase